MNDFIKALNDTATGYRAVFGHDGKLFFTSSYTRATLEDMIIPDVKAAYPDHEFIGIMSEEEYNDTFAKRVTA